VILIDNDGNLVLIRRTRPGVPVYWTTPGGGIEDTDACAEAAMHRELFEELGATAEGATQVFLASAPSELGLKIQLFFVARMTSLDLSLRDGPEIASPAKGRYDPDRVSLLDDGTALAAVALRPPCLKEFIQANRQALLAEAGFASRLAGRPIPGGWRPGGRSRRLPWPAAGGRARGPRPRGGLPG
jgi:ADP-ribose pyrophosphatase YjhB (NUDIX family)